MQLGTEAVGQDIRKGRLFPAILPCYHIDFEIILTEFPHHLPANAARGKCPGDLTALAAANSDGSKAAVSIVNSLKEGGPFSADGGGKGSIFNVAALIDCAVSAQKGSAYCVAGDRKSTRLNSSHHA